MLSSAQFRHAVRHGVRTGRSTLVLHAARSDNPSGPVQVGFVVAKNVGNAVTRNRVKRQLRHLARDRLATTPAGVELVVRALPLAATRPNDLPVDLAVAWTKVLARLGAPAL